MAGCHSLLNLRSWNTVEYPNLTSAYLYPVLLGSPCQIVVCCFFLYVLCLPACLLVCLFLDLTTVLTSCRPLDYNPNANPAILALFFLFFDNSKKMCSCISYLETGDEALVYFKYIFGTFLCFLVQISHTPDIYVCCLLTPNLTPSSILHESHVGHWPGAINRTRGYSHSRPVFMLCLTSINKISITKQQIRIDRLSNNFN